MFCRKDATGILLILVFALGCQELSQPGWDKAGCRTDPGSAVGPMRDKSAPELRIASTPPDPVPTDPAPAIQQVKATTAPQGPEVSPPPTAPQLEGNSRAQLSRLYQQAAESYARMDSYIVRFRRREQINGRDKPEELILAKIRKNPMSVYFKWLGPEGKGREVIYVQGKFEDKINTLLAAGDMPLIPAGKRFAISPDSPLVMAKSRYSIRHSGVGPLIEHFGHAVKAVEKGETPPDSLRYLGRVKRPEFETTCEAVEQRVAKNAEAVMPRGGTRLWVFDPNNKLPVVVSARDENGHEVEYYCYDLFECPVHLDDADFNPDVVWKDKR